MLRVNLLRIMGVVLEQVTIVFGEVLTIRKVSTRQLELMKKRFEAAPITSVLLGDVDRSSPINLDLFRYTVPISRWL